MTLRIHRQPLVSTVASLAALMLACVALEARALDRSDCDRSYKPYVGQAGKDVVWVPTPDELVQQMLRMAKVTPQDRVYDLGSGDGKIAIAAGKLGATAVGIEYNPDMAKLAQCYVEVAGVQGRTRIIHGDIFKEDFSPATVVTMYLLPDLNMRLRPTLLAMAPGTRVTSHQFMMGDWEPDETAMFEHRSAYLWIVPAQVQGTWTLREAGGGNAQHTVALGQTYQKLRGDVVSGGARRPLTAATLRGADLELGFADDSGAARTLVATVRGNELAGTLKGPGGAETKVTGTRVP